MVVFEPVAKLINKWKIVFFAKTRDYSLPLPHGMRTPKQHLSFQKVFCVLVSQRHED